MQCSVVQLPGMDDDEVRGGERFDLGHRATNTSSGVERRQVEFLATLPPLSGLFFFIIIVNCSFFFFLTGNISDIIVIITHHASSSLPTSYGFLLIIIIIIIRPIFFFFGSSSSSDMVSIKGWDQNSRSGRPIGPLAGRKEKEGDISGFELNSN